MLTGKFFASALLLAPQLLLAALACTPPIPKNITGPNQFPSLIPGGDEPADPATTGFFLNHVSLHVKNLTASLDFYTKVFGMRLLFNFRATEKMSVAYLAHSHGGKNGTAYQTAAELNRNKNNMEGLLEFVHYDRPDNHLAPSTQVSNTFSHLGMVVPDIAAAQARMEKFGVRILKNSNELPKAEHKLEIANAYGLGDVFKADPAEADNIFNILIGEVPGASAFIFVVDPDGNFIEVQPQEMEQLSV